MNSFFNVAPDPSVKLISSFAKMTMDDRQSIKQKDHQHAFKIGHDSAKCRDARIGRAMEWRKELRTEATNKLRIRESRISRTIENAEAFMIARMDSFMDSIREACDPLENRDQLVEKLQTKVDGLKNKWLNTLYTSRIETASLQVERFLDEVNSMNETDMMPIVLHTVKYMPTTKGGTTRAYPISN